jgi:outer membrane protein assembly factor BamB/dienelactone hydrolase
MSDSVRALSRLVAGILLMPAVALAQPGARPFTPPEDVRSRKADIISEGTRMAAEVFAPKAAPEDTKLPTVILCHGWGGVASALRPEAIAFARAGYLAIVFDYRGWGASDGRLVLAAPPAEKAGRRFTAEVQEVRGVVDPLDQATDLLNAIHWAVGEPRCDAQKIGLWGSSYSGGHVVWAAARDRRVKATVSQVPGMDSRWVVAGPVMQAQTYREATRRARGEAGYPEPGTRVVGNLVGAPIRERMIDYAPVEDAGRRDDCAMLFIIAGDEELFDNRDHGIKAHQLARGPKKLVTIPGIRHYGIYNEAREQARKLAIGWFDEHLKGEKPSSPGKSEDAKPDDKPKEAEEAKEAENSPAPRGDARDWPMYNRDVTGSRHNPAETAIGPASAGRLVEKWRFPAEGSTETIGVVHATPTVVNGYVYFGTATDPTFYKLSPDGKVRWSYRNPDRPSGRAAPEARRGDEPYRNERFRSSAEGIMTSALVADDTVYFGDLGGWFYALDRATGAERWKVSTRSPSFPGGHPFNVVFASPILADGKVIAGGGTLEQVFAGTTLYPGSTGRGFVMALEPRTGRVAWKYDVGPRPERLEPPITIADSWGEHTFAFGPATSSVWSTPSFDAETGTVFFGTDVNTAPRRPTADDPRLDTRESCAVIALDVRDGREKWVTKISPGDVWTNAMRSYDPKEGRYKDQAVGDTPKVYTIDLDGRPTKVVGAGCKDGGFYVLRADDGRIVAHTPIYTGPPSYPLAPEPDRRMLALPSLIGGLQTGCATDGKTIYTNGIDALRMGSQEQPSRSAVPPTGGRVVAISADTTRELWRHERPNVASLGGPPPKPVYTDVGDPIASGVAVANGVVYVTAVASGKLVALDAASGTALKEVVLGPVWSGPSVSRGRVYVGSGNTLFNPPDFEAYFPKRYTGTLFCFGLPGDDEVGRLGSGTE